MQTRKSAPDNIKRNKNKVMNEKDSDINSNLL